MGRLALVIVTLAALLGGCTGQRAVTHPASSDTSSTPHRRVVEWIGTGRRDSYSCSLLAGARKAARTLGVDLLVRDTAGMTWAEQGRLLKLVLDSPIDDRPHALVLDPINYAPLVLMVRSAHDQEIPVVLVDPDRNPAFVGNPGFIWAFISSDENAVGRRAAAQLLGGRPGETLLVTSSASDADRSNGFLSGIQANPGFPEPHQLTVTGKSPDNDKATVRNFLRSHPKIVGAFATDAAAAVALARSKAGRKKPFPVVAADAEPEELELVRTGALQALVVRPGFQVGEVAAGVAAGAVWWQAGPHQVIPPTVLTEESFKGLATGTKRGFDFVSDCSP